MMHNFNELFYNFIKKIRMVRIVNGEIVYDNVNTPRSTNNSTTRREIVNNYSNQIKKNIFFL
jgi:hypothetical protein